MTVKREEEMTVSEMPEEQIKHMAEQFLRWKLPENFNPDGGISFKREFNENTPFPMKREPSGTNLFGYHDAVAMVRHMLTGLPTPKPEATLDDLAAAGAIESISFSASEKDSGTRPIWFDETPPDGTLLYTHPPKPEATEGRVTVAYAYCCNGPTKYCDCVNPNHGTALMGRNEAGDDYPIVLEATECGAHEKPSAEQYKHPEWLWYCESTSGQPVVTFGRWAKHPQQRRYKIAEIQPTEHDHPVSHEILAAENARLREALQNMIGVYDTPLSRRRFPQDDFMKEAIQTARAALATPVIASGEPTQEERLRSALQAAVDVIQDYLAYEHDGDPWNEDARAMGDMDINDYARDGRLAYALSVLGVPLVGADRKEG